MILNPQGDMYYTVGDKVFYNPLLMMQEAKSTNQEPVFHFYDEIIDTFDWSIDYTKTLDWGTLCRDRALEIRREWNKVRIWYSGGRDSYLAMKSFVNNGIFIDEIAVIDHNYPGSEYPIIIEWLKNNKNLLHPDTKIKSYKVTESVYYQRIQSHWAEDPYLGTVCPVLTMSEIQKYLMKKDMPNNIAEVSGFEKPRVFKGKGSDHWTQYYNDNESKFWLGVFDHTPFFLSKNVPIFQYNTHHLINYIENVVMPKHNLTDYEIINSQFFKSVGWSTSSNGLRTFHGASTEAEISPFWFDLCEATLRTEYADLYMGLPSRKINCFADGSRRIDTIQWKTVEDNWTPEIAQQFKAGVMLADSMYEDFYQNGSPIYNTKVIHSKHNPVK